MMRLLVLLLVGVSVTSARWGFWGGRNRDNVNDGTNDDDDAGSAPYDLQQFVGDVELLFPDVTCDDKKQFLRDMFPRLDENSDWFTWAVSILCCGDDEQVEADDSTPTREELKHFVRDSGLRDSEAPCDEKKEMIVTQYPTLTESRRGRRRLNYAMALLCCQTEDDLTRRKLRRFVRRNGLKDSDVTCDEKIEILLNEYSTLTERKRLYRYALETIGCQDQASTTPPPPPTSPPPPPPTSSPPPPPTTTPTGPPRGGAVTTTPPPPPTSPPPPPPTSPPPPPPTTTPTGPPRGGAVTTTPPPPPTAPPPPHPTSPPPPLPTPTGPPTAGDDPATGDPATVPPSEFTTV